MSESTYLQGTRAAYDTVAESYAALVPPMFEEDLFGRAMLGVFAELVRAGNGGPVADLGCGPGHVTSHLRALGLDAFGVDLSAGMVEVARRTYPELRFEQGSMTGLGLPDGKLGALVAWYSIVHTPPEVLPVVFAEFHRVLVPGGYLQLAFKAGERLRHLDHAYGHDLSLDVYWTPAERVAELLGAAGLEVEARLVREPNEAERPRQGPQAYLLARKPG